MNRAKKTYLMLGGTFLPAFGAIAVLSIINKQPLELKGVKNIMVFAIAAAIGGFITSKIITDMENGN